MEQEISGFSEGSVGRNGWQCGGRNHPGPCQRRMNDKFARVHGQGEKSKVLLRRCPRAERYIHGRQVPFGSAGFILLAAHKVPVRGAILNGSS